MKMKIFMKVKDFGTHNPFELSEYQQSKQKRRIVDIMNQMIFSYGTNERRIRKIYNVIDYNEYIR